MVKDGEDWKRITNDELEKLGPNFSRCTSRDVTPLSNKLPEYENRAGLIVSLKKKS